MLVITTSGSPIEGQTYSLTCDLMGDESLDATESFKWDRTPTPKNSTLQTATLSFTALTVADAGNYTCNNTITSPYLISSRTNTQMATVRVLGMMLQHNAICL